MGKTSAKPFQSHPVRYVCLLIVLRKIGSEILRPWGVTFLRDV